MEKKTIKKKYFELVLNKLDILDKMNKSQRYEIGDKVIISPQPLNENKVNFYYGNNQYKESLIQKQAIIVNKYVFNSGFRPGKRQSICYTLDIDARQNHWANSDFNYTEKSVNEIIDNLIL